MKEKKKVKGGKRVGAGRKPSDRKKEAVTVYTDTSRFGGKAGARKAIYGFLDGDPLPDGYVKIKKVGAVKSDGTVMKDVTKPTTDLKPQEQPRTNYSANALIDAQIAELEKELKSPPKNPLIGERAWIKIREQKIQELRNQLK